MLCALIVMECSLGYNLYCIIKIRSKSYHVIVSWKLIWNQKIDMVNIDILSLADFLNHKFYLSKSLQETKVVRLNGYGFGMLWRIDWAVSDAISIGKKNFVFFLCPCCFLEHIWKKNGYFFDRVYSFHDFGLFFFFGSFVCEKNPGLWIICF